jgi:Ca2+-binding EF-hand superfamily protein
MELMRIDLDSDGHVRFDEFRGLLGNPGAGIAKSDVRKRFREVDPDRNRLINCAQLIE